MATTNFETGTTIASTWLNDVDAHVYDQETIAHDADNISYTPAGTGAHGRTAQEKFREVMSVFDFMTEEEIADVQAGTALLDVSDAIQAAIYAAEGRKLFFPTGLYRITKKLYFWGKTAIVGELAGIGVVGNRGVTIYADATLTDFMLENAAINSSPPDTDILHGFRIENITLRGNASGTRVSSGINLGGFGDVSGIKSLRVMNLDIGVKVGKASAGTEGEQLLATVRELSVYSCHTGILFEECRYGASIHTLNGDNYGKFIHMKNCAENFHLSVKNFHVEQPDTTSTEIVHIDNCNGSLFSASDIDLDIADADTALGASYSFVKITRTTATTKAKVRIDNIQIGGGSFYVLNDVDQSITWRLSDLGNASYGVLYHNINSCFSSGQGYIQFGKEYNTSFTPVVADAATGGNTGTCTVGNAKSKRIGDVVHVSFNITAIGTGGMTSGNDLYIQGLPVAASSGFSRQMGSALALNIASGNVYSCSINGGSSAIRLMKTGNVPVTVGDVTSGSGLVYVTISYQV